MTQPAQRLLFRAVHHDEIERMRQAEAAGLRNEWTVYDCVWFQDENDPFLLAL
jgi:hypothetical protein